jgi:beta-lactam-binding protein with PASTA domain
MVIDAATCSNTGSYTVNNSFTEALELSRTNFDGVAGYKSSTSTSETPSVTHSTSTGRQSLIGLVVKAASLPALPAQAANPSPANSARIVSTTADLSWTAGSGAASHNVYFGTSNPPPFIGNQTGTTFDTGTMSNGTTYYWLINEKNTGGTTTGTIWNFTTGVSVPNIVGMTETAARAAVTGANLTVGTVTYQYSDTVAANNVISQSPAGGTFVDTGIAVNLVISLGKPVVPNVVGMTQAAAAAAITAVDNLTVGTVTQAYSDTVAAGLVISQNPTGGTAVNIGSSVNLVISLGKPVVPNVVGMTQAAAAAAITAVDNLTVGTVTQAYSDTVAAGLVISQNPTGGTAVNIGSSVNLVISLGKPVVPNVVGMTQAAAAAAITAVDNLTVGTVTQAYSDTVAAGLVISQSPVGGTAANIGSSVDLVISLGKPVVPDVVGQTQAAAEAAITAVDSLTVGTVTEQSSETVPAGNVISQNPTGGTEVNTGSSVDLVVSIG